MHLFSWLRKRTIDRAQTRRTPWRKPIPRFRPQLETLEGRVVPSTLTVTNNLDSGPGSLRAAIAAAQPDDVIRVAPGLDGQTITLTSGELDITQDLAIHGPGAGELTISGGNTSRIFELDGAGTNVTLSGLTLSQGDGLGTTDPGDGGAVYNNGSTLTVSACTLSGNSTPVNGGAIFNLGTLAVRDCTLSGNSVQASNGAGGAIYNGAFFTPDGTETVTATVSACALSGNSAGYGGAIENNGALTVTHSSLSGNFLGPFAGGAGGAIDNSWTLTITQSTLSGNSATFGFGGAVSSFGALTIDQSTLCDNSANGGQGGAVGVAFNYGLNFPPALTLNQCILSGNSADTATYAYNGDVFVGQGGAIANAGDPVTLNQCVLRDNSASAGQGGGIYNLDGTVTINQGILTGNAAAGGVGGAIYNNSDGFGGIGTLTIDRSIVSGNSANAGGGIDNDVGGVLSVEQSLVAGNSAPAGAGADLYNAGSATLIDSVVFTIDGGGSLVVRHH